MVRTATRWFSAAFLTVAVLAVALPAPAHATGIPAPREVSAKWQTGANIASRVILSWLPGGDGPFWYEIYMAKSPQAGAADWRFIKRADTTIAELSLRDLGVDAPLTLAFKVFAVRVTDGGDTLRSEGALGIAQWNSSGDGGLHFTSTPILKGIVNQLYRYESHATSSDTSVTIRYGLKSGPDAMTVDSVTGVVEWTPKVAGSYTVQVSATDGNGHTIWQTFTIVVGGGDAQKGVVFGQITDKATGAGIAGAVVEFFPVANGVIGRDGYTTKTNDGGFYDIGLPVGSYAAYATAEGYVGAWYASNSSNTAVVVVATNQRDTVNIALARAAVALLSGRIVNGAGQGIAGAKVTAIRKGGVNDTSKDGYGRTYVAETNGDGFYHILVTPGRYIVRADAKGYVGHWADTAHEMADAVVFTVGEGDTVVVNITLTEAPRPEMCVVAGTVSDSAGPIKGAKVVVSSIDASNAMKWITDARTDSNGTWAVEVPCGGTYTAYAAAERHYVQYYNGKSNPLEADRITVTGRTSGIDFNLEGVTVTTVTLSGTVFACDSVGSRMPSKVIAFVYRNDNLVAVNAVATDSLGNYTLQVPGPGVFLLQAVPADEHFAPSYYTEDHTCAADWHRASMVKVGDASRTGLDIYVKKAGRRAGFARLLGRVRVVGGTPAESYLDGASVIATDANGDIAGYAITDADGNFLVDSLEPGSYILGIDKVQFVTVTGATLTCDYDANVSPSSEITAKRETVSGIERVALAPTSVALEQNYPNPFNPTTMISFGVPKSDMVDLSVFTVAGQKVATLVHGVQAAGTYTVTFDATNLPTGTYVYRLTTSAGTVAKRMVELK